MKPLDIITKYGIKHSYIQKKLGVSKGGLHHILHIKTSPQRKEELENILKGLASGLLEDLKDNA